MKLRGNLGKARKRIRSGLGVVWYATAPEQWRFWINSTNWSNWMNLGVGETSLASQGQTLRGWDQIRAC